MRHANSVTIANIPPQLTCRLLSHFRPELRHSDLCETAAPQGGIGGRTERAQKHTKNMAVNMFLKGTKRIAMMAHRKDGLDSELTTRSGHRPTPPPPHTSPDTGEPKIS
jgi:hypothetical protein